MILSEKQKEAIRTINDNNVTIITGGPGTGKTTIIKSIIEINKQKKYKIVLCAPTGRAAKRMTETTGEEAQTLHRLLEIGKVDDDVFYKKDENYSIKRQGQNYCADYNGYGNVDRKNTDRNKDTACVRLQRSVAIFPARLTLLRSRQAAEDSSGCGIPQDGRWKTNEKL
jgi:ATP-dependent exoDNAse (exonuclease V) alpha subunit